MYYHRKKQYDIYQQKELKWDDYEIYFMRVNIIWMKYEVNKLIKYLLIIFYYIFIYRLLNIYQINKISLYICY